MSSLTRYSLIVGLIILLCFGVGFGYLFVGKLVEYIGGAALASAPLPNLNAAPPQSTKIFDRQGNLLYEIGSVHRQTVSLSDVSQNVRNAFLAAEDKSFYTNPGISLRSIIRAAQTDVGQDQLLQGGSTITQQLAQELVVSKENTISRKLKELVVSLVLTHKYSKDAILERYLNEAPVGGDLVGLGTAAQVYFGVPVKDLSIAQGAYIAAMVNAPTTLDPYLNRQGLDDRQQLVLERMYKFGFIDQQTLDQAKAEKVTFLPRQTTFKDPFFSLYVRQLLEQQFSQQQINDGLNVQTTLDPGLQTQAEQIIKKQLPQNVKDWNATNAALVAVNPQTGQILAYVGGADFSTSQVDILTSNRQPGSTIKPLYYYTAFANGYTPDTLALDAIQDFGGGYRPTDYGGGATGKYVTLRTALAASLNIPSLHVLRGVGIPKATANMSLMGFPILPNYQYTLPLGLGAVEVSPLDMTQSFATLANGGKQIKISPLLKVVDHNGKVLLDNTGTRATKQILDANAVAGVTGIISDYKTKKQIYSTQYFNNYTLADRPAAAKTGTSSGPKDTWTIGYTPSLLTTVWTGNTSGANEADKADGINTAAPIWHQFMTQALAGTPVEQFPVYQEPKLDQDHRFIDRPVTSRTTTPQSTSSVNPEGSGQ